MDNVFDGHRSLLITYLISNPGVAGSIPEWHMPALLMLNVHHDIEKANRPQGM